jgi:hypothetical protein
MAKATDEKLLAKKRVLGACEKADEAATSAAASQSLPAVVGAGLGAWLKQRSEIRRRIGKKIVLRRATVGRSLIFRPEPIFWTLYVSHV